MRKLLSIVSICGVCVFFCSLLTSCDDSGDGLVHSGSCGAKTFSACGGDPAGTWDIEAVCIQGNLADEYNSVLSGSCQGGFERVTVAAAGSVTYDAKTATYKGKSQRLSSNHYSPSCAQATFGFEPLDAEACNKIQIANSENDEGSVVKCQLKGGNCSCSSTTTVDVTGTNTYVITDSRIDEEDGTRYEFCVKGGTMDQREKIYGDAYVITTLKKR